MEERALERVTWKEGSRQKIMKSHITNTSIQTVPNGQYSPKQLMNYLTNLNQ